MRVERLACQVSDALGVSAIAMGDQREGLAIATRAVLYGAGEAGHREGTRHRLRGAEVTRLPVRKIESDREADRSA